MDEFYFDKKIKQVFETAPDFQPDPEALRDMRQRLREAKAGRASAFAMSALWPALLLLLFTMGGGGYLLWQNNNLARDVKRLQGLYSETIHRDTIIEKQVIYRFDTIYSVVYRDHFVRSAPALYLNTAPQTFIEGAQGYKAGWSGGIGGLSLLELKSSSSLLASDVDPARTAPVAPPAPIGELMPLESLVFGGAIMSRRPNRPDFSPILDRDWPEPEKPRIPIHYHFTPSGLGAGANFSPLTVIQNAPGGNASQFGVHLAIEFPGDRRLLTGAEFLTLDFEAKDNADLSRYPQVDPQDPADELHELKGNFSYLQIPIEFEQSLWKSSNFRSAVSFGIVAYKPVRQRFNYEFIGQFEEYDRSATFRRGNFSTDNLRFGLGVDYRFLKRVWVRPRFHYQHGLSLNEAEYFPLRYWAASIGLRYDL